MEIPEILSALAQTHHELPRRVLQAAIARKDEIIPHLLEMLERAANDPEAAIESPNWDYGFAMFLLAQFRETRAYPLLIKLASMPTDILNDLLGDSLTEDLHKLLASVCGGDTKLIRELIENPKADEFARSAAIDSLVVLYASQQLSREELMEYFKSLFHGGLEKQHSFVWDGLIGSAMDVYPEEVYQEIQQAYADDLADESVQSLEDIEQNMRQGKEALLAKLDRRYHLIDDAIGEMQNWVWHDPPEISEAERLAALGWSEAFARMRQEVPEMLGPPHHHDDEQLPYRAPQKIGRNEPCPCGSGKKYKKCCGA